MNATNDIPKIYVCECATPCIDYCERAANACMVAMIETGSDAEIVASGILRESARIRFNVEGRLLYDARTINRAGAFSRIDGRADYGRDNGKRHGMRSELLADSREDSGAHDASGIVIVCDEHASDTIARADAADRLSAIVANLSSGSATIARAIARLIAYSATYGDKVKTAAERNRASLDRAIIRNAIAEASADIRAEVSECFAVLGFTRNTTRPDARGGDGSGSRLRDGRALPTPNRTTGARAASAGGL